MSTSTVSAAGKPAAANDPHWTHRLNDGTTVLVRSINKADAPLERKFIERLSPAAKRFRFLGQIGTPSDALIKSLTDIDREHEVAFVALIHDDGEKKEIGVGRFCVAPDGQSCECAITVADDWRERGLGTLLMRHLIDFARERGIHEMVSIDAADNYAMRDLSLHLGFTREVDPEDSTLVIHRLTL